MLSSLVGKGGTDAAAKESAQQMMLHAAEKGAATSAGSMAAQDAMTPTVTTPQPMPSMTNEQMQLAQLLQSMQQGRA
jgi:hypothetical protein